MGYIGMTRSWALDESPSEDHSGCVGAKAAFQSIKALVNATGYLSHDEGAPEGRHLGIQVLPQSSRLAAIS